MNSTNITTFTTNNNELSYAETISRVQEISAISKACNIACMSEELSLNDVAFAFTGIARLSEALSELISK